MWSVALALLISTCSIATLVEVVGLIEDLALADRLDTKAQRQSLNFSDGLV